MAYTRTWQFLVYMCRWASVPELQAVGVSTCTNVHQTTVNIHVWCAVWLVFVEPVRLNLYMMMHKLTVRGLPGHCKHWHGWDRLALISCWLYWAIMWGLVTKQACNQLSGMFDNWTALHNKSMHTLQRPMLIDKTRTRMAWLSSCYVRKIVTC